MTTNTTRRAFLQGAPIAASVLANPALAGIDAELPVEKINRLGRELAIALNEYDAGRWHAVVYPSDKHEFAVGFVVTDVQIPPLVALKNQIQLTKEAMAKAYPEKDIHAYSTIEEGDGHATVVFLTGRREG